MSGSDLFQSLTMMTIDAITLRLGSTVAAVTLIVLIKIKASTGLLCLECSDVPSARDCYTVRECGPNEVCYSAEIVSTSGHIYRNMGCRDRMQCSSGIVGKRSLVRETVDIPVCDDCCDSLWCQAKLCQDTEYDAGRGRICYNCLNQLPETMCNHIKECSRDEVCFESNKISPSGRLLRQSGCYGKSLCDSVNANPDFHPTNDTCWNCCPDDVCNSRCDLQKAEPAQSSEVIASNKMQNKNSQLELCKSMTRLTFITCVDSTPEAMCKCEAANVC